MNNIPQLIPGHAYLFREEGGVAVGILISQTRNEQPDTCASIEVVWLTVTNPKIRQMHEPPWVGRDGEVIQKFWEVETIPLVWLEMLQIEKI